ncbi:MAG: hypothetical protein EU535_05105 [Promethearchaeota archaeon]|nr:MAG: hypothetical protein EU535_05105 [Candidatus Lokiarchaeota archaeon]
MRIHTFEKRFSLDDIFSVINNKIEPSFKIDENSYLDESNLLIIGINEKDQSVIIRGSIDNSKNRLYLSISAIHSNIILKEQNTSKNISTFRKELGKILFDMVKNSKGEEKNFAFSNLAIKKPKERKFQAQLVETEKEILIKLIHAFEGRDNSSTILRKYPFSLSAMDGPWEIWQNIYGPYIDLVENKLIISKNDSLRTFRNYDFALNRAYHQLIADLVVFEVEEQNSNSISERSEDNFKKLHVKIEDQYSDEVEKENSNLKITFVFTNKKKQQLKLIQILKLTDEVRKFTQLLHKKVLKQYSKIDPQIIFISLFGFETTLGEYLRDNLHGNLDKNISILIVPPIDKNLWNNYFVKASIESKNIYQKHSSGINLKDYNNLRKNGAYNQTQLKEMDTYYKELMETKRISDYNSQQLEIWADTLNINNSSTLLDVMNSRDKIKELEIE